MHLWKQIFFSLRPNDEDVQLEDEFYTEYTEFMLNLKSF